MNDKRYVELLSFVKELEQLSRRYNMYIQPNPNLKDFCVCIVEDPENDEPNILAHCLSYSSGYYFDDVWVKE